MPFDPDAFLADEDAAPAPAAKAAPGGFDPDRFLSGGDLAGTDAGPEARRAARLVGTGTMRSEPAFPSAPVDVTDRGLERGVNVSGTAFGIAPLSPNTVPAQDVAANRAQATREMGSILPMLAAPAVGKVATTALGASLPAAVAAGALEGGAAGLGVEGGSATGAAIGAAIPLAGAALSGLISGAKGRVMERMFKDYGQAAAGAGKAKTLTKLEKIGPEAFDDVVTRHGIGKISNPQVAREATAKAVESVGSDIGGVYDAATATGVTRPVPIKGNKSSMFTDLRREYGSLGATAPLNAAVGKYERALTEAHGGKGFITPTDLHTEISKLRQKGFSGTGVELSPADSKVVARDLASTMQKHLDDMLAEASKKSPIAKAAAARLPALNKDYTVLKTLDAIVKPAALAQRFELAQNAARSPSLTSKLTFPIRHPIETAKTVMRPADAVLARMLSLRAAGQTIGPELTTAGINAGLAPDLLRRLDVAHGH